MQDASGIKGGVMDSYNRFGSGKFLVVDKIVSAAKRILLVNNSLL
jgi:hypothetical protein